MCCICAIDRYYPFFRIGSDDTYNPNKQFLNPPNRVYSRTRFNYRGVQCCSVSLASLRGV
jgi:hypothetical protein